MSNYTVKCVNETNFNLFDNNFNFNCIIDWLLLITLIIAMFSIGCEVSWIQLKHHIKHPLGIGIGMVSQFFIIPLTAYTLLRSCSVKGLHATSVLIISCCPGGILSNSFAYFCDGDVSLSVVMTFMLTITAIGMMPFNLWIYGNSFETDNLVVPYGKLALSLLSIIIPVSAGLLLSWRLPQIIKVITKIAKFISFFGILFCIILEAIYLPNVIGSVPSNVRRILLALPALGFALGYVLAYSFKQDVSIRKTIATECGIQNVTTAITVINSSFEPEFKDSMLLLPWLYIFAIMSACSIFCILYQMFMQYVSLKTRKETGFNLEIIESLQINSKAEATIIEK